MENNLRKIIIDGEEIGVNPAMTILQACEYIDKELPANAVLSEDKIVALKIAFKRAGIQRKIHEKVMQSS